MRLSTVRARSSLPLRSSHRGLSGMKNSTRKNRAAGSVSAPNMPRHLSVIQIRCIVSEA